MQSAQINDHLSQPECSIGWQKVPTPDCPNPQGSLDICGLEKFLIDQELGVEAFRIVHRRCLFISEIASLCQYDDPLGSGLDLHFARRSKVEIMDGKNRTV